MPETLFPSIPEILLDFCGQPPLAARGDCTYPRAASSTLDRRASRSVGHGGWAGGRPLRGRRALNRNILSFEDATLSCIADFLVLLT